MHIGSLFHTIFCKKQRTGKIKVVLKTEEQLWIVKRRQRDKKKTKSVDKDEKITRITCSRTVNIRKQKVVLYLYIQVLYGLYALKTVSFNRGPCVDGPYLLVFADEKKCVQIKKMREPSGRSYFYYLLAKWCVLRPESERFNDSSSEDLNRF
jgi:hypothetical protein